MQSLIRLRWLLCRACTPDVLHSRQVGMTVHALYQLDMLTVSTSPASPTNILGVVRALCVESDGRSQANLLHALACATGEQCSPRVVVQEELRDTLQTLQEQLVETAASLTAPETILVMEALLKLAPFASDAGLLVHQRLLDEVQERSMALASVVERSVDLLGVTRVAVEAATSKASTTASSSMSLQSLTSVGAAAWANDTLEQVLRVVQARLDTFANQDLISLMDVLTVRRTTAEPLRAAPDAAPSSSSPLSASSEKANTLDSLAADAGDKTMLLDAARFLLDDLLNRALRTVPSLSAAQLSAWLARLVNLHLTEHPLLSAVVKRLLTASRDRKEFTTAQLSSSASKLAALLPVVVAKQDGLSSKEVYVKAYVHFLNQLVTQLHQRPRADPAVFAEAQASLLPQLGNVPEAALDAYLVQAATVDERMSHSGAFSSLGGSSTQVRIFCVLHETLEKAAALLLRHFSELSSRDQAQVAAFVFHWRLYMHAAAKDSVAVEREEFLAAGEKHDTVGRLPRAVEMICQSTLLTIETVSRRHHAVCGLVDGSLADWGAKDVVQVLNEVVLAHHTHSGGRRGPQQSVQHSLVNEADGTSTTVASPATDQRAMLEAAAATERIELAAHLSARLQGPLEDSLKDIHTAQLVRYLTSLSKMNFRARAPYNTVLLALKGRSLTSFEQISVLGVLARHHLRSPYVVYGVVRDLPQLGQSLHTSQKALLLKYLGQVGAQRLVKAPCAEGLLPDVFFPGADELARLSTLELVFCFNGLVELRQHRNPTTAKVLAELVARMSPPSEGDNQLVTRHSLFSIRSATTLAEFVASLCRYGGPSKGVSAPLLIEALEVLKLRLTTSRSLFVDLTQLIWYWPCVEGYMQPTSVLWCGSTPAQAEALTMDCNDEKEGKRALQETFTAAEWEALTRAFSDTRAAAKTQLRRRLVDIANSSQLRRNTFLWNQLACGIRFDALPPHDSHELARLWENLDRKDLAPLLGNPQQLLDVMAVALHRLSNSAEDTEPMLRFVRKHVASMRVQDSLQVWWHVSQFLAALKHASVAQEKTRQLLLAVRYAAKEHTMHEDKAAEEKLSETELRLMRSLM